MSSLRLEASERAGRYASFSEFHTQVVTSGYDMYGWVGEKFYQLYPGGRCIDYTETIKRDAERTPRMANEKVWTQEQREAAAKEVLRVCQLPHKPHVLDIAVDLQCELTEVTAERDRMDRLINTPSTGNFLASVELEAAHQVLRWASEHDAGKTDADWFWLIGYLAGKVLRPGQATEKRLHHIITTAAVCLNWHRHVTGEITEMRPGIEPPTDRNTGGHDAK